MISELKFQDTIFEYVALRGWRCYHVTNVKGRLRGPGAVGFPDLVLLRPPRLIFAELKNEVRGITAEQFLWLEALQKTEAEVYLWRPSDWPEIEEILK